MDSILVRLRNKIVAHSLFLLTKKNLGKWMTTSPTLSTRLASSKKIKKEKRQESYFYY